MRARRTAALVTGVAGGMALGFLAWSTVQRQYRRDLFSRYAVRRYAALGYLRGQRTIEAAHLLREYVSWERRPALRQRGVRMLREIESVLG